MAVFVKVRSPMITINPNKASLTTTQLEALKPLSSCVLSDALDVVLGRLSPAEQPVHIGGCLPGGIQEIRHYDTPMIGTATTIYAPNGTSLPLHLAMATHAQDHILIISTDECTNVAYMGDIQALLSARNHCAGIVIDGYIRDRQGIAELDMPVFSRGSLPKRPTKEELGGINVPIQIGDTHINPGDIIFGDTDGVVIIPATLLALVIDEAIKKEESDNNRKNKVAQFNFANAHTTLDYIDIMTKDVADFVKTNQDKL